MPREPIAAEHAGSRYPSLSSFYLADQGRIASREVDVGLWWRDGADGPLYRAAWVCDTGELYLVRLGPVEAGGGEVEILAQVADRDELEKALEGWRDECGAEDSLAWLRERVARLRDRARRVRQRVVTAAAGTLTISSIVLLAT